MPCRRLFYLTSYPCPGLTGSRSRLDPATSHRSLTSNSLRNYWSIPGATCTARSSPTGCRSGRQMTSLRVRSLSCPETGRSPYLSMACSQNLDAPADCSCRWRKHRRISVMLLGSVCRNSCQRRGLPSGSSAPGRLLFVFASRRRTRNLVQAFLNSMS